MRAICDGTSGLPETGPGNTRESYLKLWAAQERGEDPAQVPGFATMAWNLASSLLAFVADGLTTVTAEQYRERLQICDTCDKRTGATCTLCGCNTEIKAHGRAFQCPQNLWPTISPNEGNEQ